MSAPRRFAAFSALAVVACGRIGYDLEASEQPAGSGGHGGQAATDAAIADAAIADGADDSLDSSDAANVPVACNGDVPGVADECTELPKLPTAPTIDGLPDCALPVYPLTPVGWTVDSGPPDALASYAVAWRPNGLYFYVRVTDPTPIVADASESAADGDGVELFVDADGSYAAPPNYDDPGTRRFVIAAPPDAVTPTARGEVWSGATQVEAAWTSTQFRAFPLSFGYVVEAFVTLADLGLSGVTLAAGNAVGWDLAINVSFTSPTETGPNGHRLGQYFLHGSISPETNVTGFCRATLDAP